MRVTNLLIFSLFAVLPNQTSMRLGAVPTTLPVVEVEETNQVDSFQIPPIVYSTKDSVRVEQLFQQAKDRPATMDRMEFFGRQFLNIPYVAKTLEVHPEQEKLIVNLFQLDCTTFVENCAALSIADMRGEKTFQGFCKALTQLRYKKGECKGYASRLHYFYNWVTDNEQMGLVSRVEANEFPFTQEKKLDLHYMTAHPTHYRQLQQHSNHLKEIRALEQSLDGFILRYIPKGLLYLSPEQLSYVKNGDIIAIITQKDGLDTTHLGIAVWQGRKLHLMNASSIYKKVVLDKNSFYQYMAKRTMNLGIGIVRVNNIDNI